MSIESLRCVVLEGPWPAYGNRDVVRDPAGVLDWVFGFLGLEPTGPSEPVEGGANEKYFGQWQELKRDPRMRAYLDLVSLRYERRVRRYGYSLLFPA